MKVKIVFDAVDIIDGIKDSFSVHVSMEEDVFSARVVNLEPSPEMLNGKADAIINTASGETASFPDGADGVPMKSMVVSMQPIQSLNGYDHPWPAGGGTNKLDPTHTYTGLTYNPTVGATLNVAVASPSKITDNGGGSFTFDVTAAWDNRGWLVPVTAGNTYMISVKFSGVGVRTTVGLLDEDFKVLTRANNSSNPQTISTTYTPSVDGYWYCCITTNANNDITIDNPIFSVGSTAPASWTPYSNICTISGLTGLSVYVGPTQDPNDATVYAVIWSTQAGMVYGCTVNLVTGLLTVDRAYKAFDGTEDWGIVNGAYFMTVVGTLNSIVNDSAISTHYLDNPNISIGNYQLGFRCYNRSASPYTGAAVLVRPEAPLTTSLADFKAWLVTQNTNGTPFAVCFELATPITYQLSPQEVETLKGQNHVWSDAGDVDLTYVADTKLYIDNKIAQAIAAALNA